MYLTREGKRKENSKYEDAPEIGREIKKGKKLKDAPQVISQITRTANKEMVTCH
jgi:hypothetical protein